MERMSKEDMDNKYCLIQASFDSPLPYELENEHIAERLRADWLRMGYERLEKENKELKQTLRDAQVLTGEDAVIFQERMDKATAEHLKRMESENA